MNRAARWAGLLMLVIFALAWPFYADNFAIKKTNRLRSLANGWVSMYAKLYLDKDITITKKIKKAVDADLVHGRFRPAFFVYTTSPYALSPLIHGRKSAQEGRPYTKLINGDLRLFSYILLATVALSFVFMSLVIYNYTNEIIFSFIPVFFIPLSHSLTCNLLSDFIDSQEVPLILTISVWIFLFFTSIRLERKWLRILFFTTSLCVLLIAFLVKETSIAISIPISGILLVLLIYRSKNKKNNSAIRFALVSFSFTLTLSALVVWIVLSYRHGYASRYSIEEDSSIVTSIKSLWTWMSTYSLNNIYGYIPVVLTAAILPVKLNGKINNIPTAHHIALFITMLFLSYGFLAVLIPWKPLGIKYLLPGVFFFSFTVAFSLSLLAVWAKERYKKKGFFVYLFLFVYLALYFSYREQSDQEKKYWIERGDYGTSVVDELADSIAGEFNSSNLKKQYVFVEFTGDKDIFYERLHLMRIVNLEKGINLMNKDGDQVLNYKMPGAELSSFKVYDNKKMLYLSDSKKELGSVDFDCIYKRYKKGSTVKDILFFNDIQYKFTGSCIEYASVVFDSFSLCKYISVQENK